tara:strand:+ start:203 stop:523 length:321 start_codon:yes stop_codon:yes gene_type:complete
MLKGDIMTWEDTLKGYKKINMNSMRKIVDHILETTNPKLIAVSSLESMVVSTYKKYNPTQKKLHMGSILANMLKNRGYFRLGGRGDVVRVDDLSGQKMKGTFYEKV